MCHIFYGSASCGGASYLLDGPTAPGAASWLPASWNSDGLRAEVLQIDSVLDTVCVRSISAFSREHVSLTWRVSSPLQVLGVREDRWRCSTIHGCGGVRPG